MIDKREYSDKQVNRIRAVLYASEEVVSRALKHGDKETILMAKETAYDHIKGIIDDVAYCPWQE